MCGSKSSKTAPVPQSTYTPNPNAVADTSADSQRKAAIVAGTETQQPSTFGAELGG